MKPGNLASISLGCRQASPVGATSLLGVYCYRSCCRTALKSRGSAYSVAGCKMRHLQVMPVPDGRRRVPLPQVKVQCMQQSIKLESMISQLKRLHQALMYLICKHHHLTISKVPMWSQACVGLHTILIVANDNNSSFGICQAGLTFGKRKAMAMAWLGRCSVSRTGLLICCDFDIWGLVTWQLAPKAPIST